MDDCKSAVSGKRIPCEAVCAALAVRACCVVDAVQADASIRVADFRGEAWVFVPTAVTGKADAV